MPPGKRPSSDNGPTSDNDSEDGEVPRKKAKDDMFLDDRAGVIETVAMRNFMCHTSLEVPLNRHINFVVGRNGSGKSAILSAVVVALGSKASVTNRAASLKDFVKKGTNTALVQVTLSNTGMMAYKPDVYGSKITVSRTLHSSTSSSTFKIKSETGELISSKRDELQRIITAFNIQIDNPVSILNQDAARTFLATTDSKTKYAIFMKATRLEEVETLHADSLLIEETGHKKLQLCYDSLKQSEKEVKDLERQWQHLQNLKNCQERLSIVENEMFWARVRDLEKILSTMKNDFSVEEAVIKQKKDVVEKLNVDFEEAMTQIRSLKKDADNKAKEIQEAKDKLNETRENEKARKLAYGSKLREYRDVREKAKHHADEINTVTEEINKLRAQSSAENTARRKQMQEALAMCVKERAMVVATQRTTSQDYEKLQGEFYHYRDSYKQVKALQGEVVSAIDRKRKELNTLKNQKNNFSLYAPWMGQLCQRVEEAYKKRKFVRMPLGPLGSYIKAREQRWVQGIESEIGIHLLRSFYCSCPADARMLKQIMQEVIPKKSRFPGITVSSFNDKIYDIRNSMARCPGFVSLYEMLDISDPNVANCLIDSRAVEKVLLIPTHDEAAKVMSCASKPHRNCKRAIILSGDVYFPYPDYKTYATSHRIKSHLLQMSTQEAIRNLEEEIVSEQQKISSFELQLNELRDQMDSNKKEFQIVQRKQKELGDQKSKIEAQIEDLEEGLQTGSSNVEALESEVKELENKLHKIMEEEKTLDAETRRRKAVVEAAKVEAEKLQEEVEKMDGERNDIMNRLLNVKEKVKKVDMKRKESQRTYEALEEKVKEAEQKYLAQKEEVDKSIQYAQQFHPERIKTTREILEIEKEIKTCKGYVVMAEKSAGPTADVSEKLAEKRAAYIDYVESFNGMKKGLKMLRVSLKARRTLYRVVQRVMSLKVVYMFEPILGQRGYKGDMQFDHLSHTLQVKASPNSEEKTRETRSLSGGERSYSTVAFLLSLWECVEPPFYFLDEFDVFMDKVNRQIVMELLMNQAKQKRQYQYVFLTPQDTPSIRNIDEDITIHKLDDPERSYKE